MAELLLQRVPSIRGGTDTTEAVENVAGAARGKLAENVAFSGDGITRTRNGCAFIGSQLGGDGGALGAWTLDATSAIAVNGNVYTFLSAGNVSGPTATAALSSLNTLNHSAEFGTVAFGIAGNVNTYADNLLYRWDGTTFTQQTNAPVYPHACAKFAQRLFVGGGTEPGVGGADRPTTLYYSDPGGPLVDAVNSWKDDVTGLVNKIVLDGPLADPIVRLIPFNRALYIFRKRSIWKLTGTGASNFVAQQVANVGMDWANLFAVTQDNIIFHDEGGFHAFNGETFNRLSANVPTIVSEAGSDYCSMIALTNETVLLSVEGDPGKLYSLHLPTNAWTSHSMETMTSYWLFDNGLFPTLLCSAGATKRVFDLTNLRSPAANERMDYYTPGGPSSYPVGLHVQTGVYRLATPQYSGQLHRIMVDYSFSTVGLTTPVTLTCNVYSEDGTLITTSALAEQATSVRTRKVIDAFQEVTSVYLEFVSTSPAQSVTAPTVDIIIHDAWIEYSIARQRRAN